MSNHPDNSEPGASPSPEDGGTSASAPQSRRRVIPIHPVLCSVFPILSLYAVNIDKQPIEHIYRFLEIYLLVGLAIWVFFLLITRQIRKSAVAASIIVLAVGSYGRLASAIPQNLLIVVTVTFAILMALPLVAVLRTRKPLLDTTSVFNFASVVLVAPSLWAIGHSMMSVHKDGPSLARTRRRVAVARKTGHAFVRPPLTAEQLANRPDVYYIILDAYERDDRLRQFYGYDNTPFIASLEKRGFYVARRSGANYDQTELCLASSLSMDYLQDLDSQLSPIVLRELVDENRVIAFLRKLGYSYVNIASGQELSRIETADVVLNDEPDLNSFEGEALGQSLAGPLPQVQRPRYDHHRDRLLGVLNNLATVAKLPGPKFVFAHLLAPHPPFVLGANGEKLYPRGALNFADASWLLMQITREQYKAGYIAQLRYINNRVLEAVDAIQAQSDRPPIIIIQGDHGSRMTLDWDSLERTDVRETFSILNAYYVPKRVRTALYGTITPVNSFRIILDREFGAKLKLLPDRSFYSTVGFPYAFTDVTNLIPRATGPGTYRPEPRPRASSR